LIRALNRAARAVSELGVRLVDLDPGLLMRAAEQQAQCDDYGSEELTNRLKVLVESAERDARLTLVGRIGMRETIVNALTMRLLRQKLLRDRPQILDTELADPIIVIGLPRSGTTLLHRLLSLAPRARSLSYWEVRKPLCPPGPDTRLAWARRQQASMKWLAPGLDAKHFSGAEQPEECMFLLDSTLLSATFWIAAPVYRYLEFYLEQDQAEAYRGYREHLRIFQAAQPGRRMTLKAPAHTAHVRALLQAIPNAKLVQLHRDPVSVVGSMNSLFYSLHRVVTDDVDLERMARTNLELLATGIDRNLLARDELGTTNIVDVYYRDLVADPVATLERLAERLELPFDAEYRRRSSEFVRANPQHKHGRHRYQAQDFALSEPEIRARFARYSERFPDVGPGTAA
jgi:hypothetical protein